MDSTITESGEQKSITVFSSDEYLLKSSQELRLGNIGKATMEIRVDGDKDSSSLASFLRKRLVRTGNHMEKAKENYHKKQWEAVLKHTKVAIEEGVDLCTELYLYRAEAFLATSLIEEAVSELSSAILCLFKKHGFKAPEKNEEEAAINQDKFDKAILNITEDKCEKLLKVEEEELHELEEELADRVNGLKGAVSLITKFYEPLLAQRSERIQLLIGKKERFCTEKLAQSLKKKQEEAFDEEEEFP
ncbi:unnamed protein product [Brassica oleracea var. botrytis]